MSYNGWKNYETWAVNLWLENDEGTYNEVTEKATEVVKAEEDDLEGRTREGVLSDWAKDYVEEIVFGEEMPASLASDLLGAAMSEVDWYELAEAWLTEAREEQAREQS